MSSSGSGVDWDSSALETAVIAVGNRLLKQMALGMSDDIRKDMQEEKSGIKYKRMRRASSAPGESPATQKTDLMKSVQVEDVHPLLKLVGTNLPYGRFLELGTKNIKPRPWLRPAFVRLLANSAKYRPE
jgi:phage gpG-like protein